MSGKKPVAEAAESSAATSSEKNWDPFGDKATENAFGNLSSPAKTSPSSLAKIEKEMEDVKIALADIYTRLPLDRENQAFVTSEGIVADGLAMGAAATNTLLPGVSTLARGAVASVKAVAARVSGARSTFEKEVASLKKILDDALKRGVGRGDGLSRSAYPIVLGFMSLENPTLADVTKFRADIALSRANIRAHWKDKILLKTSIFKKYEALAEESGASGGRKTRALRKNMRSKTVKSQRLR